MIEKNKLKCLAPYLGLFLIYLVVHSFLLLNKSFYWDDWIWMLNPNEFRIALDELGVVFFKDFYAYLVTWPITAIKFFVFVCYFTSGLFLYKTLKKFSFLDAKIAFYASALYLVVPFNIIGRSTVCTVPYGVSLALLFIGLFTYLKFRQSKKNWWLLLAVPALTFSFNTTSVLVVYIAAMMCLELAIGYNEKISLKGHVKNIFIVMLVALIHTVAFYFVKTKYFPVHGIYYEYNQLSLGFMVFLRLFSQGAAVLYFESLAFSFFGKEFVRDEYRILRWIYMLLLYFPIIYAVLRKNYKSMWISLLGVGLVFAAIFPYLAVNKIPTTFSWDSRHQLLLPIGAAIWILGIFLLIKKDSFRQILFAVFLIFFSLGTARMYLSIQGLRYQDLSLQSELSKVVDPSVSGAYVLTDRGYAPGVLDHDWNYYEFTGMLYKLTGAQKNFMILGSHMPTVSLSTIPESYGRYKHRYMLAEAKWAEPFYCLKMNELVRLDELEALSILVDEIINPEVADKRIAQVYRLDKLNAVWQNNSIRCLTY